MSVEIPLPHGGKLCDLRLDEGAAQKTLSRLEDLGEAKILRKRLDDHLYWDLVLLAVGAYSPLEGYMGSRDYRSVLDECRLDSGLLWAIPISLPLREEEAAEISSMKKEVVVLFPPGAEGADTNDRGSRCPENEDFGSPLAVVEIEEVFEIDAEDEASKVFRTTDPNHPGVARLLTDGRFRVGGRVEVVGRIESPYPSYPFTPEETRRAFEEAGWKTVVAFQTRNPIHRAHEYLCKCALEITDGLLIHPVVGTTKDDDIAADVRMRCYEVLIEHYFPKDRVMIACFPAPMRYAGPKEALHHAIVRRNYGASHFVIGRDHAGVGDYYGTYEAQEFVSSFDYSELGITPLFFEHAFYCQSCGGMATSKTCGHPDSDHRHLSGTKVREYLREGKALPQSFTRPEVAELLRSHAQGLDSQR